MRSMRFRKTVVGQIAQGVIFATLTHAHARHKLMAFADKATQTANDGTNDTHVDTCRPSAPLPGFGCFPHPILLSLRPHRCPGLPMLVGPTRAHSQFLVSQFL